jgi:hypothetical protein
VHINAIYDHLDRLRMTPTMPLAGHLHFMLMSVWEHLNYFVANNFTRSSRSQACKALLFGNDYIEAHYVGDTLNVTAIKKFIENTDCADV